MSLARFRDALAGKLEQTKDAAQREIPAGNVRNQLPGRTLPPTGNTGSGYTAAPHDHTSDSDGGVLTAPVLDSYAVLEEIAAPSAPAANTLRFYAKDKSGITEFFYKNSAGTERDLSTTGGGGGSLSITDGVTTVSPVDDLSLVGATITDDGGGAATLTITGGGGNSTSTGAAGSEPGSPATGDLYLPNNGVVIERYSGAEWTPWGPIYPLKAPIDANYAWVNQGGATKDLTSGGIFLQTDATGSTNIRIRKKAAPSTPYTITICFIPHFIVTTSADSQNMGLLFRESSSGKLHTFVYATQNNAELQLWSTKWSDPQNFTGHYFANTYTPMLRSGGPVFMRIADDGANRICSYSNDGQHWQVVDTQGRTDFLTANEVGFFVSNNGTGRATGMQLLSWVEA